MDKLKKGFEACAAQLREFGYLDVTPELIKQAHDNWMRGIENTDIIAKFAERDFEEYPTIFGRPAHSKGAR